MVKLNSKSTVWYEPDLFADGGYEVPATWDEFIALNDQIVADGGTPQVLAGTATVDADRLVRKHLHPPGRRGGVRHALQRPKATGPTSPSRMRSRRCRGPQGRVRRRRYDEANGVDFVAGISLIYAPDADRYMYYEGGFVGGIAVGDINPDLVVGRHDQLLPVPDHRGRRGRGRDHDRWRRDGRLHRQSGRRGADAVHREP